MKTCRRAACVLLAAASFFASPAAYPTSYSTDQSDLYYIVLEAGWGIQLVQRGSVIFATIFIYGPSGAPTWYVATLQPSAPTSGNLTWSGDLYATTGTYFGTVPFAGFVANKVGTMTWVATSSTTGTLTYDVNGVNVVKNVTRQTLVNDDYSGTYLGAFHGLATGCTSSANNTPPFDVPFATITVTQTGSNITFVITIGTASLTVTGTLSQDGQFGTVVGSYTATGGEVGNGTITEINVQKNSLTATFALNSTNDGCQNSGYVAGMRAMP